jgi:hypothetical protein
MGGLAWFDKIFQACQGPTSFIAYERGWVIFEYSAVVVLSCAQFRASGVGVIISKLFFDGKRHKVTTDYDMTG